MSATIAVPQCPKCAGAMWDNRDDKKNAKAPDFKCKSKTCLDEKGFVTALWLKDLAKSAPAAAPKQAVSLGGPLPYEQTETGAPPVTTFDTGTPPALGKLFTLYEQCLRRAVRLSKELDDSAVGSTPESVTAMTATLFIAATNKGLAA